MAMQQAEEEEEKPAGETFALAAARQRSANRRFAGRPP